ncbi:MAG: His/Gly/Thr/Pro-type tRNA ligase C-terminal domain-containing protein [Candidatus Paceibacterota bacterium]
MKTQKEKAKKVKIIHKTELLSPELEKAAGIASYYGFTKLPIFSVEKKDIVFAKKFRESHLKNLNPFLHKNERFGGFLEEKIAILRAFLEKKFIDLPQPVMGFYEGPLEGNPHMKKNNEDGTFNIEVIGGSKSICEAMVIEASYVILKDRYPEYTFSVVINSVGDKEAYSRFFKELTNYISKNAGNLDKSCLAIVKKNPTALFDCAHEKCKTTQDGAPRPIAFLNESGRNHFKEVLEYLESLCIPYELNHALVGSRSYCTDTVFELQGKKITSKGIETHILGIGERYNGLAKRALQKKDVPAVGAALLIHPHFIKKNIVKKKDVKAKFFYIQIGFDAKLKSLTLIEMLRKAGVYVIQSLAKDKLSAQLEQVTKMGIPYIIMMGQREASENSVVVRNMDSMSQETVSIDHLVKYLKKLK